MAGDSHEQSPQRLDWEVVWGSAPSTCKESGIDYGEEWLGYPSFAGSLHSFN